MKYTVLLLILCVLASCGPSETKKVISTFENGQPEEVRFYLQKSDTLSYRQEFYYKSGQLSYMGNVVNGIKDGTWKWWHENGQRKGQGKYIDGFYTDTVYHWSSSGDLDQIEIVGKNRIRPSGCCQCNGTIIRYYPNGNVKEKFSMLNDKHIDSSKIWNENGRLRAEWFFVNGELEGVGKTYREDGGWTIKTYKNGILSGPTRELQIDSSGILIVKGQYENGKETGLWVWMNKDSSLNYTAVYKNGQVNGEYVLYHLNGKVKVKATLANGEYDGLCYTYDEKGKLINTERY